MDNYSEKHGILAYNNWADKHNFSSNRVLPTWDELTLSEQEEWNLAANKDGSTAIPLSWNGSVFSELIAKIPVFGQDERGRPVLSPQASEHYGESIQKAAHRLIAIWETQGKKFSSEVDVKTKPEQEKFLATRAAFDEKMASPALRGLLEVLEVMPPPRSAADIAAWEAILSRCQTTLGDNAKLIQTATQERL